MLDADFARLQSSSRGVHVPATSRRPLRNAAEALVLVHPRVLRLSDDELVEDMAIDLDIDPDSYAALTVAMFGREVTLVCVCSSAWHGTGRSAFFELKAMAAAVGHNIVLVPERFIRREPRLTNAMMVAGAADAQLGLTDRMKLLAHLVDHGGSAPLLDLAVLVQGDEPVSAIMSLVIEGGLYIDLDKPILPSTEVHLVQPL